MPLSPNLLLLLYCIPISSSVLYSYLLTNLPDRISIPQEKVLKNLWDHYGKPDEGAKSIWQKIFDTSRELNDPIMNFLSRWTISKTKLDNVDRSRTNHYLITKFKMATMHNPRVKSFITELKRLYSGDQTWDQVLNLARK